MALRFYIVPKTGDGLSPETGFRPKYIDPSGQWAAMDFGRDDSFLVGADVTPAQHTSISANGDVISVPLNIDNQIGGALAQVQSSLESVRIPSGWVNATHTYRDVIRFAGKLTQLWQRFDGMFAKSFYEVGITLNTTRNELTVNQRNAFSNAITSLGTLQGVTYDLSSVVGTTTVRQVIKIVADQMPAFRLMGQVF